jgi:hypothetical protein
MPQRVTYNSTAQVQDPIHDEPPNLARGRGGFLPRVHFEAEVSGRNELVIQRGLIVARVTGGIAENEMTGAQVYYPPYSPTGAYGTGTDTAFGILRESMDYTLPFNRTVTPVHTGEAYTSACYVAGGARGDISAAIKTDLANITWRD